MRWFKLFTEARNDAKLRALNPEQFRVWFNLLCIGAEQETPGVISGYPPILLAVEVAQGNEELLATTLSLLERLQIIDRDGETVTFINFATRQYDKPSDHPARVSERVKRHRERNKGVSVENNGDTSSVETPLKRDVTRCNALEEKRREENNNNLSPHAPPREEHPRIPPPAPKPQTWEAASPQPEPIHDNQPHSLESSPVYPAILEACQIDPEGMSFRLRQKVVLAASRLNGKYTPEQIALAAKAWPLEYAPTPEQLSDDIKKLLNAKPLNENGQSNNGTAPRGRESDVSRRARERREHYASLGITDAPATNVGGSAGPSVPGLPILAVGLNGARRH